MSRPTKKRVIIDQLSDVVYNPNLWDAYKNQSATALILGFSQKKILGNLIGFYLE